MTPALRNFQSSAEYCDNIKNQKQKPLCFAYCCRALMVPASNSLLSFSVNCGLNIGNKVKIAVISLIKASMLPFLMLRSRKIFKRFFLNFLFCHSYPMLILGVVSTLGLLLGKLRYMTAMHTCASVSEAGKSNFHESPAYNQTLPSVFTLRYNGQASSVNKTWVRRSLHDWG